MKSLENFRPKCAFVFNLLEKDERPSEGSLRAHLFEELKEHPLIALFMTARRSRGSNFHSAASALASSQRQELMFSLSGSHTAGLCWVL